MRSYLATPSKKVPDEFAGTSGIQLFTLVAKVYESGKGGELEDSVGCESYHDALVAATGGAATRRGFVFLHEVRERKRRADFYRFTARSFVL